VLADFLTRYVDATRLNRPHARLLLQLDDAGCACDIEEGLMVLALNNLVDNAVAFSPIHQPIVIELHKCVIAVQDGGVGVSDFALPKLGQKFFSTVRPDGVTKGSGLGLAIVQQIMALHGGRLHLLNTQPGLRVELHLPA
jgi:two-component system sensor histidine kinase CreC